MDDGTRLRLIEAGLAAFAQNGLNGVSLRSVNTAANARNSGATHYHFGGRFGLFEAIVEHITRITPEEVDGFASGIAPEPNSLLHEVARFLSPFFVMRGRRPWGRNALLFLSQVSSSNDPAIAALWQGALGEEALRDCARIAQHLPHVSALTLKRRMIYAVTQAMTALASPMGMAATVFGDLSHAGAREAIVDLLQFIAGGMAAPEPAA